MNRTVKCFYFWYISCEHQDQCIMSASNTVLLKSKLTVPRIPILATRFSNLATFENPMSQDLRFWPKVTRLWESRADLRNIMSLLLDWSLEVEIHQIDCPLVKRITKYMLWTVTNSFCKPLFLMWWNKVCTFETCLPV